MPVRCSSVTYARIFETHSKGYFSRAKVLLDLNIASNRFELSVRRNAIDQAQSKRAARECESPPTWSSELHSDFLFRGRG